MRLNLMDTVGEWNPQLFRELKGRMKSRNIAIAVAVSLLTQLLVLFSFYQKLPVYIGPEHTYTNPYCTGKSVYEYTSNPYYYCFRRATGEFVINWQSWSLGAFVLLAMVGVFAMIGLGTFLLISDLDREERRGTLNFIRLTPQSTFKLLLGKLLGVPSLLYLGALLAIPLHLWLGINANISVGSLFLYYAVFLVSCLFFFSLALTIGIATSWLGGFQPWLGAGAAIGFLYCTIWIVQSMAYDHPFAWVAMLSPLSYIPHIRESNVVPLYTYHDDNITRLQWYYLPLGKTYLTFTLLGIANFAAFTRALWLCLQRCFRNPNATLLSKTQSYFVTTGFIVAISGFAARHSLPQGSGSALDSLLMRFSLLMILICCYFLFLIAALTPHRQALYDWARYRHFNRTSGLQEELTGEKSPALFAIGVNIAIAITPIVLLVLLSSVDLERKLECFYSLGLGACIILLYSAIAQQFLLMKTPHRIWWAMGGVGVAMALPPVILGILTVDPSHQSFPWLFTVFAPAIPLFDSYSAVSFSFVPVLLAVLGQVILIGSLNLKLTQNLIVAGESQAKALLASR